MTFHPRNITLATVKALLLIGGPLACGLVLFALEAPAQHPGVYLKTRQGVYPIAGYTEQSATMFAGVSEKVQTAPGSARGWVQFFVVADDDAKSSAGCAAARMFFVRLIEGEPAEYRPISTEARRLDSRVCHVSSPELKHWGDAPDPVVKYYYDAKPSSARPLTVLVALMFDNQDGSRQIYPVLNYPPSGPRLVLAPFQ
jgi:hypothetical protein